VKRFCIWFFIALVPFAFALCSHVLAVMLLFFPLACYRACFLENNDCTLSVYTHMLRGQGK